MKRLMAAKAARGRVTGRVSAYIFGDVSREGLTRPGVELLPNGMRWRLQSFGGGTVKRQGWKGSGGERPACAGWRPLGWRASRGGNAFVRGASALNGSPPVEEVSSPGRAASRA